MPRMEFKVKKHPGSTAIRSYNIPNLPIHEKPSPEPIIPVRSRSKLPTSRFVCDVALDPRIIADPM
jgi:hypothetical protein